MGRRKVGRSREEALAELREIMLAERRERLRQAAESAESRLPGGANGPFPVSEGGL